MHRLLTRQLKKLSYDGNSLSKKKLSQLLDVVNQAYIDADADRYLLENTLQISSEEMQKLYTELGIKSKQALQKSEKKYEILIKNLEEIYFFYSHDTEGIFSYVNESVTKILGYSQDEFLAHYGKYLKKNPIDKEIRKNTKKALNELRTEPYKVAMKHKDGTEKILEIIESPVFIDGKVISIDGIARDITQEYKSQEKIAFLASKDPLTGISNRYFFEEKANRVIASSSRQKSNLAFLFLDIDKFKHINDIFGHSVGDKFLVSIVERIQPNIRQEDIFARIGGDEFVIILNNIDQKYLTNTVSKILKLVRKSWSVAGEKIYASTSIGISLYPQDGNTLEELMKKADIALYEAKGSGRDNFNFYTEKLNQAIHNEMKLANDMKKAIKNNELHLFYQPKVQTKDDIIFGAEALIRWQHPELGLITPNRFINLAENIGQINSIGNWVIKKGCEAISKFNLLTNRDIHLSVNISPKQLIKGRLYENLKESLNKTKINPTQLMIEITESVMVEEKEKIVGYLKKIKSLGVHICIDDFGTGYSSLSYLHRLPIDSIKMDKEFIDLIPENGSTNVLVDTIIAMGNTLNTPVVAEGVEKEFQREYLFKKGCLYYQGWLFKKALTEGEFVKLLKTSLK